MGTYDNGSYSKDEILQEALQSDIIDFDMLYQRIKDMKRKEIISNHPFSIWQNKEGLWMTYLPDAQKGRVFRKRKTQKEIEDVIIAYYEQQKEEIYIRDVFKEWSESKLKYGEIKKQSYDRYCTDFERFFPNSHSICRKKMKNITSADLMDFVKSSIHNQELTKKSYAGLRTLLNGIFKYGKMKGYTEISITQFFGDLELPKNIFNKKIVTKEEQIFMEDEIPLVTNYLKNHVDIWNMGILLQFQTGMRIGEISALKPEDIHEDHISVQRTEVKFKDSSGKCIVTTQEFAKTDAGNRDQAILIAVILVCVGVIGLGVVESREDEELRKKRQEAGNYQYAKSWLALTLPLAYCLLDAAGTYADNRVLETLDESSANVAYELTFLAAAVVCFIYVIVVKKDHFTFKLEVPKYTGAICETAGQFAYIFAIADSKHLAMSAPMISSYCVVSVLWSRIFLKEKLSWKHYLMIFFVAIGIVIMGVYDV